MRHREFFLKETQAEKAGVQTEEISKLRSIGVQFKHTLEDQEMLNKNRRVLEEVNKDKIKAEETQERKNKTEDSFKSSKRRVRRGSDPIHNKAQPFS